MKKIYIIIVSLVLLSLASYFAYGAYENNRICEMTYKSTIEPKIKNIATAKYKCEVKYLEAKESKFETMEGKYYLIESIAKNGFGVDMVTTFACREEIISGLKVGVCFMYFENTMLESVKNYSLDYMVMESTSVE